MQRTAFFLAVCFSSLPNWAAPLSTAARSVIPSEVQQVISVDYRRVANFSTAQALKNKVFPEPLKQFETALRAVGVSPENDIDQLTFASFRANNALRMVGIAQGQFSVQKVKARLAAKKIKGTKLSDSFYYPVSPGMQMIMLDPTTMLFGEVEAIKAAMAARDGELRTINDNLQVIDMVQSVESEPIWSVLDSAGTQNMVKSALGDAAGLADFETVKKRLLGSHYTLDLSNGADFNLDVVTSDRITAATLSSLMKAGMLYRKLNASAAEKSALESTSVDSDAGKLNIHFKSDEKKFVSLVNSDLFSTITK